MKIFMTLLILLLSAGGHANRFVVTGKPVELKVHPGYFTFPEAYTTRSKGYHFVRYVHTRRVCFMTEQPAFSSLDKVQITISNGGKKNNWQCYRFDPDYFEIDY